ncbi:MAG TPA: helix-turn-helix transcriptional regulator [Streptosporangiaceae bacterium]
MSRRGPKWTSVENPRDPFGIKARVRKSLELDGATQADLAKHLGVSEKHISQVLTGRITGSPEFLARMAEACGLSLIVEEEP